MGQAKQRGTFEERKAAAIERGVVKKKRFFTDREFIRAAFKESVKSPIGVRITDAGSKKFRG